MKTFSIVVPVYFNELNLPETVPELLQLESKLENYKLELVFVDDGSGDNSLSILLDYQKKYPDKVKVVKLTRNFGSMAAVQAGFTVATGDCIGMISADLQDPPELFLEMIAHWEKGIKCVFAVRQERKDSFVQKLFASTHYSLMKRFAIKDYPKEGFDFFLIDRQIVEEVNQIQEKNSHLMSLIFWLGHTHVMIPYVRKKREKGKSRWTFGKKFKLFIDSFVGFSYVPIRFLSLVGFIFALIAFIYAVCILYFWAMKDIPVKGWAPLMMILLFTSGIQMMMIGVLGEYLWRTLEESRKRPHFVIDEIIGKS